jgi:hypothetical protein
MDLPVLLSFHALSAKKTKREVYKHFSNYKLLYKIHVTFEVTFKYVMLHYFGISFKKTDLFYDIMII